MAFLSDSNWVRQDMAHPLAYIRIMSKLLKKKKHIKQQSLKIWYLKQLQNKRFGEKNDRQSTYDVAKMQIQDKWVVQQEKYIIGKFTSCSNRKEN